jgi:uncharacterized iron-regulated membrane protein
MSKSLLLTLHRWISLIGALPLCAIIATGLILSFEPMLQLSSIGGGAIDADKIIGLLQRYDPDGRARGFSLDAAAQRLTLQGPNAPVIDLSTGQTVAAPSPRDGLFPWARRTHERLLGQPWLVTAATCAMVVIMALGILMGWPRLRHSLAGWHKGAAWFSLPLILLSPLTGLCMAFGLSFQADPDLGHAARPVGLPEAVRRVAQFHDLAQVGSIGIRGGRMMARIFEGGEWRAYALTADGLTALPRNWPRALHEGNWSAIAGSVLNLAISVVLLGLLSTGVVLWARRQLRRPRRRGSDAPVRPGLA